MTTNADSVNANNLIDAGSPPGDILHRDSGQSTMWSKDNNGAMDQLLKREGMGRSSSGNVNNEVGATNTTLQAAVSLNPSTQSFETTYQPLELMNAQVGTIAIGERNAVPGTKATL